MTTRDWVSAMMNDLLNCRKANKKETAITPTSNLIIEILKIMKSCRYIEDYKIENEKFDKIKIKIGKLNSCGSIKPRFFVKKNEFEKYIRRFLPARDFGILIVSTNKGIMTHKEAIEKGLGGSLIAYAY